MGLAPVSLRGSVQTAVLNRKSPNGSSGTSVNTTGNVAVQSYIWHPWFARVSSDVSVGYDLTTGDDDSSSALRASGSARLDILPRSDYPVTLSVAHLESRISGDFVSSDSISDRAGVSARAAITPSLKAGLRANWDRTDREGSGIRTGLRANLNLDKTFNEDTAVLGIRTIGLQAGLRRSDFSATDAEENDSVFDRANLRLNLRSEPRKNVLVNARFTVSLQDFADEDDDETRLIAQGLSTLQWRPETLPFTVTGALRLLHEDISQVRDASTLGRTTNLASANLGLRWPVNDNLALNFGVRASYDDTEHDEGIDIDRESDQTGARFETGVIAGLSYASDKHPIAGFDWRWNAQLRTSNGFDSEEGLDSRDLIQFRHQVERRIDGIFFWPVSLTGTQGLQLRLDTEDDDGLFSGGITHSVSLGYNRADGGSSGFGRLSIRDSRNIIGETREFQSVQVRFGHRLALDRDRRLSGNLNARAGRNVDSDGETDTSTSLTAELRYEHRELFEVRGLGFRSTLRANVFDIAELFGAAEDSLTDTDALSNDWRNILTYRIGRLSTEAEASIFHRDNGFGYLLMFRLHRSFGGRL